MSSETTTSLGAVPGLVCQACRRPSESCTCTQFPAYCPAPVCRCGRRLVSAEKPSFLTPETESATPSRPPRVCDGCVACASCCTCPRINGRCDCGHMVRPPTQAPVPRPGLLQQLLLQLHDLRMVLPTRTPTPEELTEDPTALDTCLRAAHEDLNLLEALLRGDPAPMRPTSAPGEELSMGEELLRRGWMHLTHLTQPDATIREALGHLPTNAFGAVRLSDGLTLWARSCREMLARVDAVSAAATQDVPRPWWVPPGLTLDPDTKSVRWPEPTASEVSHD